MIKKPIVFVACFLASHLVGLAQPTETKLTSAEKAYILSRFCTEVKYNFAFKNRLGFNLDSACIASMPALVSTVTDEEFVKGLQMLCAQLKDGHTYVFQLNNPVSAADWIKPFPMKTKRIGNKVFVTGVFSSKLQKSGVVAGCEIQRIDDEDVVEYADRHIRRYLASSTPQWSDYRPFAEFELTKDKASRVSKILFADKNGKEFEIESDRNYSWDLADRNPPIRFKTLNGNVGLLTVSSFQDSDFSRSYFNKLYDDILKTDALIIDIRDNSGGNSAHADYLISHFSDQPIAQGRWTTPMHIAAHASWHYPQEWYSATPDSITPVADKPIYQKPVVLLVNATTFSSAENFCVSFRSAKRGKILGTPTGGSTGNPIFIDLGGGIGCCICTKHELDAEGNEFVGIGIQPDITVEEDADSFLNGKDAVIEKAIDVLRRRDEP